MSIKLSYLVYYIECIWWAHLGSNQGPTGYEPVALPLSYRPMRLIILIIILNFSVYRQGYFIISFNIFLPCISSCAHVKGTTVIILFLL